jgi:hypothetical protein
MPRGVRNPKPEEPETKQEPVVTDEVTKETEVPQTGSDLSETPEVDKELPKTEDESTGKPADDESSNKLDSDKVDDALVKCELCDSYMVPGEDESMVCTNPDCASNKPPEPERQKCELCGADISEVDSSCTNVDCESNKSPEPEGVQCAACDIGHVIEVDGVMTCNNADCVSHKQATTPDDPANNDTTQPAFSNITPTSPTEPESELLHKFDMSAPEIGSEVALKLSTIRVYDTAVSTTYRRLPGPLFTYGTLIQRGRIQVSDTLNGEYIGWVALDDMKV